MATRTRTISVSCPSCRQAFNTQVTSIIDVGDQPALKRKLLAGQLNVAACSHCGAAGILGMPFAYHDPDKELLFVFMPTESGLPANEQQKVIGSFTQDVMNSLPAEKRKAYLFSPKTFILLDSMVQAILEADGITKEMIEKQRAQSQLINELLQVSDDETLRDLAERHAEAIDYEFFQILTASAGAAAEEGKQDLANALLGLRSRLMKLLAPADAEKLESTAEAITREDLLQRLRDSQDEEEFDELIAAGRPMIDYTFYLGIADLIEAAEKDGRRDDAQELTALRERILDATGRLDQEVQEAIGEANELLSRLVQSEDPATIIEEAADSLSDMFFYVLSANIDHLAKEGGEKDEDLIRRLQEIATLAGDALERRMPPVLKLINRLLRAETTAEREALLNEDPTLPNQELIDVVDALIAQFTPAENQSMSRRLTELRDLLASRVSLAASDGAE
jgi:hypothetical protein